MLRRGFSVIEILVAALMAGVVFMSFMSAFQSSYQYARMTRDRAVAILLGQTLLDEMEAHPYGAPAPLSWLQPDEAPAQIWIEGRPVRMLFHKKITYLNSSFIGKDTQNQDFDVVTIVISWKESGGPTQSNDSGDNQQLQLTVPQWR